MKRNHRSNLMPRVAMVVVSLLAVAAAYGVTFGWADEEQRAVWSGSGVVMATLAAWLPAAWRLERYSSFRAVKMESLARGAVNAAGQHALVFVTLLYLLDIDNLAVSSLAVFYAALLLLLPTLCVGVRSVTKYFRRRGKGISRVVVVGADETAERLAGTFSSDEGFGYKVVGVFSDKEIDESVWGGVYRGSYDELEEYVGRQGVDEIYCTVADETDPGLRLAVTAAEKNMTRCYFVPRLSRYAGSGLEMRELGHMVVFAPRESPLESVVGRGLKRGCDIMIAGVGAVLFPIVWVPVAIAIKLSSRGPVFYRQRRTGYMGKEFSCLKFRTMHCGASDSAQCGKNDPRVTSVGRFLRHTSLDELPQVFNILAGDMSVVGPRPHMISQTEEYSRLIDRYMVRHSVRPGLTGWAQVNGFRGTTDRLWKMERRVEHDVWYIEHWSLMLDLKIILRTALNILRGEENAF
ncbi:MAG: undecaprenyl-phosphate glucose phosphotransferase [Bacteroides sp.]|nr:undecaprenyl-phosphate glucose phosphotransferase [Bacteroides sp.]